MAAGRWRVRCGRQRGGGYGADDGEAEGMVRATGRRRVRCERWGGGGYGAVAEVATGRRAASRGWRGVEAVTRRQGGAEAGRRRGEEGRWAGGKT
ncbi:hypothetical protein GUJ93_ZPchr0008g13261 [Zizania palustris]|uniref:Uncharacterized protein n=1 Tax=Zizania palustris TaxID=103762 RepID=A0A8J5V1W3_ZIZPA|nr:hypothetical protein GUJ93_ZPchr0008g13261 [Zizania palustris]